MDDIALLFGGTAMIGTRIANRAGVAYTDFRIHGDRLSRMMRTRVEVTRGQQNRALLAVLRVWRIRRTVTGDGGVDRLPRLRGPVCPGTRI